MSICIQIEGWEVEGLRCPDHSISFSNEGGEIIPITLIQMPNGTGKTTTLKLLRSALSGSAEQWDPEVVMQFRKQTKATSSGFFQVLLRISDHKLTIRMRFDFDTGSVRYSTTYYRPGYTEGFNPPPEVKKFFNPNFVNFFVFDGELANQLLDQSSTNAQMVIEELFQLRLFQTISNRVDDYWEVETKGAGAREQRGLTKYRNEVKKIEDRLRVVREARKMVLDALAQYSSELAQRKMDLESIINEDEELRKKLENAKINMAKTTEEIKLLSSNSLMMIRHPHALHSEWAKQLVKFKLSLDRVKLPESTAREFFEELAEEELCVCGRIISDAERKTIRERAAHYLGSDDNALLYAIKGAVADYVEDDLTTPEHDLNVTLDDLKKLVTQQQAIQNVIDSLGGDGRDSDINDLRKRIAELDGELDYNNDILEEYDSKYNRNLPTRETKAIAVLEARKETARKKVSEITGTVKLKERGDILKSILSNAHEIAKSAINDEICINANKHIESLMPNNMIRIQKINRSLILKGQEGGSAGETLTIAYAFISSLFNRSQYHELPFIVDSPAGALDGDIRGEVAQLIPKLSKQFIAFIISTERPGFLSDLERYAGSEIQYITLFRAGPMAWEQKARKVEETNESIDGFYVPGRSFFNEFQLESER